MQLNKGIMLEAEPVEENYHFERQYSLSGGNLAQKTPYMGI
jgi:hypothetical protein